MKRVLLCLFLAKTFYSCDMPQCKNTNPIFDKYAPDSQEYMRELKKQLEADHSEGAQFWILPYEEKDGREYLHTRVVKSHLCATMIFDITGNSRLEQLRKNKGGGYIGAGLSGIGYNILDEGGTLYFKLLTIDRIID